ncbi:hypothetical protein [Streptomyces europaeiscabiei]|uniref:hypothetical protein n=1 Tax=Streptomyces europaeiscabiei TaxID=146819 RepID=UPI000E679658|nr:hypothetical protein [Streptomyces europaeiscabiei]
MPAFQPEPWRTDPRERLLAAIDRTWARGELGATPEELVDGYAHHLAEQLRKAHNEQRPYHHGGQPCVPKFDCGVRKLIDGIDPKAQR